MSLRIIFSKKIIALFLLATTFFSIGYFFLPLRELNADVCFQVDVQAFPVHGTLVGDELYIANAVISVLDTTNGVVTDIPVGSGPSYSILVGTDLYVLNTGSDNISVIDTNTHVVTDTIAVGARPRGAVFLNGNLYISNTDSDNISVIDVDTNTVVDTIDVGVEPLYSVSRGDDIYVLNEGGGTISVIDTNTNTVTDTIVGMSGPRTFLIVDSYLYITNNLSNTISVIDTNTNTIMDTITVGSNPNNLVLVGSDIYVGNVSDGTVSVIDTNTNTVTDTIGGMSTPYYISRIGTFLYISNYTSGEVSVIDTATNSIVDTVTVGTEPNFSVVVGTDLYVLNFTSQDVSVINTLTNEVRDACRPLLLSAEIVNSNLTLTYDENLNESSIPDPDDFSVVVDGITVNVVSVEVEDDTVILVIDPQAQYADVVTVSYVVPSSNPAEDVAGNNILALTNQSVTNNTESCAIIVVGDNPYSASVVGNYLYTNDTSSSAISVVDTTTRQVVATISLDNAAQYSTVVGSNIYASDGVNIYVIDTNTNTVSNTLSFPGYLSGVAVGTDIYLIADSAGEVGVLDTLTNTITDTITVGTNPFFSVAAGNYVYVINQVSSDVSVIDINTNTVVDTISVGSNPFSATVVDEYIYINNYSDSSISVIDTNINTVVETVSIPSGSHFSLYLDGFLYLTQYDLSSILVLDVSDNSVVDTVDIGSSEGAGPYFLNTVNGLIYISDANLNVIRIFDPNTNDLYACQSFFTLTYSAGPGGSLTGDLSQNVNQGQDGTPVTALPDNGYRFDGWSDADDSNPRTDVGVTSNVSVVAYFSRISSSDGGSVGAMGTSVHGRFRNLVVMGKFEEAYDLIEEYPDMFTSEHHFEYTFCDNALFTNFMKKKDVDGRYSAYYQDTVTEISKLQSFVNKLFIYQYLQASGPIDGIFGSLTKKGVERLQNLLNGAVELDKDLVIDGIVGPLTRAAVNDFCLPRNFNS